MADQAGVEIYKRFYPWPDRFRLGDPVLVQQITGMSWPDFTRANEEQSQAIEEARESGEEATVDQVVLAGLVAIAFWQGNPHMSREKARRTLERIPMEEIEIVGDDVEEVDSRPPDVETTAGGTPSMTSSASDASPEAAEKTEILQDSISDETNPNGSGLPSSPNARPESLPA